MLPIALRVGTPCSSSCSSPHCILSVPVDMRIIQMQSDALLVTFVCQLLQDVALERCCIHDIIVRISSLEHRESLMMTGSKANILRSRRLDSRYPSSCIEPRRIKASCQFSILVVVQILVGHGPLARCQHAIQTPVQENTKLSILKRLARSHVLCRWLITLRLTSSNLCLRKGCCGET